jgi:hypothetical protein
MASTSAALYSMCPVPSLQLSGRECGGEGGQLLADICSRETRWVCCYCCCWNKVDVEVVVNIGLTKWDETYSRVSQVSGYKPHLQPPQVPVFREDGVLMQRCQQDNPVATRNFSFITHGVHTGVHHFCRGQHGIDVGGLVTKMESLCTIHDTSRYRAI